MLPKASTTTHMEIKTLPLTVKIENKGSGDAEELGIYIEQERVAFDDLDDRLLDEKNKAGVGDDGKSLLSVVLRLDKDLKVQDMVDVMQVGANLGIKMVLATDKTRS
jgi:biopolymer transport protein ExbD